MTLFGEIWATIESGIKSRVTGEPKPRPPQTWANKPRGITQRGWHAYRQRKSTHAHGVIRCGANNVPKLFEVNAPVKRRARHPARDGVTFLTSAPRSDANAAAALVLACMVEHLSLTTSKCVDMRTGEAPEIEAYALWTGLPYETTKAALHLLEARGDITVLPQLMKLNDDGLPRGRAVERFPTKHVLVELGIWDKLETTRAVQRRKAALANRKQERKEAVQEFIPLEETLSEKTRQSRAFWHIRDVKEDHPDWTAEQVFAEVDRRIALEV